MTVESLTNRGEYLSAYYLGELLPGVVKKEYLPRWTEAEKTTAARTPRAGIRALRRTYFDLKAEIVELMADDAERDKLRAKLHELHDEVLRALAFSPRPAERSVIRAGTEHVVAVAHAEGGVLAIECGWATDTDAATESDGAGRLANPVDVDPRTRIETGMALAGHLFALDDDPPRYVLILTGGVVTLADRLTWGEGRYLAVSLDVAFGRNDTRPGGELDMIAALFGADSLCPPEEGGAERLAELREGSRRQAVGVSAELREGLRLSVELIANEVLDRIRAAGARPEQIMEPDELGRELAREALRYLYRILFLLYAEARPELGVLPVDHPEYAEGYSLARLGDLVSRTLIGESAGGGFHLYESLDLLFRMVNEGHRPRGAEPEPEPEAASDRQTDSDEAERSDGEGIRFEPLRSELFLPEAIKLIGRSALTHPGADDRDDDGDDGDGDGRDDGDGSDARTIDTRLRNTCLYEVLRLLMLTRGKKKERGGFISYAQLGINQLGAVYEGLMSYTGFIAAEELYEVAKGGDPSDGSWMIPASRADDYPDAVFARALDDMGRRTGLRVRYPAGSFVYRLAGRDRQTSASYYTPQSLTEVTVQLTLRYRLDQDGTTTPARELLDWTICEPALGSGAFLNEAINQVAAEYLRRRQRELGASLDPERYAVELQKVKAYIALHNCYGVDLNRTAVELAEVSLWLNVMHAGLQAPWFGLHLRRGNSLIGAGRRYYEPATLADKGWLTTAPTDHPFRDGDLPDGVIHHFLLPAEGWGAVAGEKEARQLAPEEAKQLAAWRRAMLRVPADKGKNSQVKRLQGIAGRVEFLWGLVRQRLEISEREIRRHIDVWGADDLPPVTGAVPREKILADLEAPGTPYWRLKMLMDAWCALWFWPLDSVGLLDGSAAQYERDVVIVRHTEQAQPAGDAVVAPSWAKESLFDFDLDGSAEPSESSESSLPGTSKSSSTAGKTAGKVKASAVERLRRLVPLRGLDDWLTFAEALVGAKDIAADSLGAHFTSLAALEEYENGLEGWMGMDGENRLPERFPWLGVVREIADRQGFFHWELHFAQAFAGGGFDLQVGNPPWVQPDWNESTVLAEFDPWFKLADRLSADESTRRKDAILKADVDRHFFLSQFAYSVGLATMLASPSVYPLIAGTRPDLYRAFMCTVWSSLCNRGIAGLIHPDTHFGGVKEGPLRAASYEHLRFHAHFSNRLQLFAEIEGTRQFGIHIYGTSRIIKFVHLSWLFEPRALVGSLTHNGSGEKPGIKYSGEWELRPHRARMIEVNETLLAQWNRLSGGSATPLRETALLHLVTTDEQGAISALADTELRVGRLNPWMSQGFNETVAKKDGLIVWNTSVPSKLSELIIQGPHFGVSTIFSKQPNQPCKTNRDWSGWDLVSLTKEPIPRTNYTRGCDMRRYRDAQDLWNGRSYTEYFRVAWRKLIPFDTERSLFAAIIPPGPTHVHAVYTLAFPDCIRTVLTAGFWAALPLDYFLRVTGRADLTPAGVQKMPSPDPAHPLVPALLLRTLRMNSLSVAYADLWSDIFDSSWSESEIWAVGWPGLSPLGDVGPEWNWTTPLRAERERRCALVEIDALVAVWLNITADQLVAIYRSRYPVLSDYEARMWFDANGRKIAGNHNTYGHGQTKEHYVQLMAHLEDPERVAPPEGYSPPFYKADREGEMRQAHAVFSARLQAAKDAGWTP
ncbi:hypothetical protein [Frankia sp. Cr2]|uniref:hypothetical protein n=1 Tax=Frankia sp. Cr2 TaxID=3073932 RepID=UPI002AD23BD5|nr:hypothetical protein [Frankia sp. Cr2]